MSLVEQYRIFDIKENFGIDLLTFLKLPMDMIEILTEFVEQWREERKAVTNQAGSKTQKEIEAMSESELRKFIGGLNLT